MGRVRKKEKKYLLATDLCSSPTSFRSTPIRSCKLMVLEAAGGDGTPYFGFVSIGKR